MRQKLDDLYNTVSSLVSEGGYHDVWRSDIPACLAIAQKYCSAVRFPKQEGNPTARRHTYARYRFRKIESLHGLEAARRYWKKQIKSGTVNRSKKRETPTNQY